MRPLRPLTPGQAKRSLAHRLTQVADRVRQVATRLGARPYRVFLVWEEWSGGRRGEGDPCPRREMEILPTPKVATLDSVTFSIFHAGTVPAGSLKVSEVSTRFTSDELTGKMLPDHHEDQIPIAWSFFYEVVEDGRGDPMPVRRKFRLLSDPTRDVENAQWTLMLERVSEDRRRDGTSAYGTGEQG